MWISLREHLTAIREADDRRYREVNAEREKALRIKELADATALQLAREIQVYKDEKANELRAQIESERGNYITRPEHQVLLGVVSSMERTLSEKLNDATKQIALGAGMGRGMQLLLGGLAGAIASAAAIAAVIKL